MPEDRRDAIAAAAIQVIDRSGLRGLTHRAIDREAGFSLGTTSNYATTRKELLELVVRRVANLARDDVAPSREMPSTPEDAARLLAGIVEQAAARGSDARARFALALDVGRDADLHAVLTTGSSARTELLERASDLLEALGVRDPRNRATDLVGLLNGLLFDRVAGPGRHAAPADIQGILTAYLRGLA